MLPADTLPRVPSNGKSREAALPDFVRTMKNLPDDESSQILADYAACGTTSNIARLESAFSALHSIQSRGLRRALGRHGTILLSGERGTGKSTAVRLAANEFARRCHREIRYVEIDATRLAAGELGGTQRNTARMFQCMSEIAASCMAVFCVDEVDTLITNRSQVSLATSPTDVIHAVNAVLQHLDNFPENAYLVATSNLVTLMDPAALDRFDFHFAFPLPSAPQRVALIRRAVQIVAPESSVLTQLDPKAVGLKRTISAHVARLTHGFTLRGLNDAVLHSLLFNPRSVTISPRQLLLGVAEVARLLHP